MSKKNLLNEATIRQFMKYANIGNLTDNFINETYSDYTQEGLQEAEEDLDIDPEAEEAEASMPPSPEMGGEEEMEAPEDAGPEEGAELPPEAVAALEQAVEAAADAMLAALAPFGVEGEATVAGEEEPSAELPGEEVPSGDFPPEPGAPDEEEEDVGLDVIDEDGIVNETMKRVMSRITGLKRAKRNERKKEALAESVANRIIKRLRSKK